MLRLVLDSIRGEICALLALGFIIFDKSGTMISIYNNDNSVDGKQIIVLLVVMIVITHMLPMLLGRVIKTARENMPDMPKMPKMPSGNSLGNGNKKAVTSGN